MTLKSVEITHFRNLECVKVQPITKGFNFVYGYNGSGKTSFLEAIYYLSLGRSFKSSDASRIVHNNAEKLTIFAQTLETQNYPTVLLGIERQMSGELKLKIQGQYAQSIAELATYLPIQLINSHCHDLVEEGPHLRRTYLDWGLFYLNKEFLRAWRLFYKALKQRNAALKTLVSKKELEIWTRELVSSALLIDQMRRGYVIDLIPLITAMMVELYPLTSLKIEYQSGWDRAFSYEEILWKNLEKDKLLGYTQSGPHKADLKITINNIPAKDILSRGQQKLFVCAMILARGALLQSRINKLPIYLVDDLPSELDVTNRSSLIALLSKQETQIFVTAVDKTCCEDFSLCSSVKMFHVEHGKVTG